MKVTCWKANGYWFCSRKDLPWAYSNPLGRGWNASAAYYDYLNQLI